MTRPRGGSASFWGYDDDAFGSKRQPRGSEEEDIALTNAAEQIRAAERHLAVASTQLGKTERKGWWYEVNRLYHGAVKLAEILESGERR